MTTREDLLNLVPKHATLVGVDSDGCVFDTMEIKQKQCFHPLIIEHWELGAVAPAVREVASFVNLYSSGRGQNRFVSLLVVMDLLRDRADVRAAHVSLPALGDLRRWVASGAPLSNASLEEAAAQSGSAGLAEVLAWSRAVNERVARVVAHAAPFPGARESIAKIAAHSSSIVVSQTPTEALVREWAAGGLDGYVQVIAGQELGTKAEHLELASRGRFAPGRVLMIGDAPGDLQAARSLGAHFYPIAPTREAACWERFREEAYARFLAGNYGGVYERELIDAFHALLPDVMAGAAR
jgi:phosphoglycolate phosphatase-like HAD superfamily hydrolase